MVWCFNSGLTDPEQDLWLQIAKSQHELRADLTELGGTQFLALFVFRTTDFGEMSKRSLLNYY